VPSAEYYLKQAEIASRLADRDGSARNLGARQMSRVTNRSWTPEQIERLRRFVREGVSPARASVVLKRTRESVQNKARNVGSPFPHQQALRAQRRAREAEALAAIRLQ
jgi:hypothetical protein